MRYRKLRIAWSVVWGIVAVLLIVLWVRSYYYLYSAIRVVSPTTCVGWEVSEGQIELNWISDPAEASFVMTTNGPGWTGGIKSLKDYYWEENQGDSMPIEPHPFGSPTLRSFVFRKDTQVIPLWFLTVLCSLSASISWTPWSKRFALRTLLLATTLVAVGLGLLVWAVTGWPIDLRTSGNTNKDLQSELGPTNILGCIPHPYGKRSPCGGGFEEYWLDSLLSVCRSRFIATCRGTNDDSFPLPGVPRVTFLR